MDNFLVFNRIAKIQLKTQYMIPVSVFPIRAHDYSSNADKRSVGISSECELLSLRTHTSIGCATPFY